MLTDLLLILLAVLLYMFLVVVKRGFNEVIKGLESIDASLNK
jgi:hypothetical protein